MDAFVRNVKDIAAADRQAIEHLLGAPLTDNQQVVIQVTSDREKLPSTSGRATANGAAALPEWTHVYAGFSDADIAEIEKSVLSRADLTRPGR